MNRSECIDQLNKTLENNTKQQNELSLGKITSQAWENNRIECIDLIGTRQIRGYIETYKPQQSNTENQRHGAPQEENEENQNNNSQQESKYQTGTQEQSIGGIQGFAKENGSIISGLLIVVFGTLCLFFLVKYLLPFLYDALNADRLIFLEVKLPKGDSKTDREKQKEVAKDMEEKISRMSQVYRNINKLGELSVTDGIMDFIFDKAKVSFIYNYKNGNLKFIVSTYPEYRSIIEGAISAQYADASIEETSKPRYFDKKYNDIVPLEPEDNSYFPIRVFKQLEDDPMNNVLDAIGKIPDEDTFNVFMTIKPASEKFNKKAQEFADALFRRDKDFNKKTKWRKYIIMPWKFLNFLTNGPSKGLIKNTAPGANGQGDSYVRMIKAKEEALNVMGEEAGKHAFTSGLVITSSSNSKKRSVENIRNVVSAYTIYKDEYNNELDHPEKKADLFGAFFKPLWKIAVHFFVPNFFFKKNIFTINELSSLYHFPDGLFNRTPIINWMDYKVLAPPQKIPKLKEDSGYRITGIIAEEYKGGDVSEILKGINHRAVGKKEEKIDEKLVPINEISKEKLKDKEIIKKNGKKFIKKYKTKEVPAIKVFKDGLFMGLNVYRNKFTPIYMKREDRTRHQYIVGKSGGGKSVYIASLARQDIWNGDGVCVIDPHGDLVEDIMEYIPKERAKDTIYFDAGNKERPMGLNIYQLDDPDQADRLVNDATEIFIKMFGPEIFGPRIQEYFKYGSLTLLEDEEEGATLIDVPRLFTDDAFREYKVSKVKNPVVKNFWEKTYASMGEREKKEIIPYFTSKFVSFITNKMIRNIIGQTQSAFNFREVMDSGKILLINLSKGKMGEMNTKLLGMIIVAKIYNAAMSRADVPESQRRDFFFYVDEFQNFASNSFADILSEARKYRLCLIMAHQYIAQLEESNSSNIGEGGGVKDAVFGNVGTMQSFKVGAPDAEALEKEYAPTLGAQDIVGIDKYKMYIKLNVDNSTSRVFSMDSVWTQDYKNPKVAEILKEYSAKKYGRKREFVDAEITARLGMLNEEEDEEKPENPEDKNKKQKEHKNN